MKEIPSQDEETNIKSNQSDNDNGVVENGEEKSNVYKNLNESIKKMLTDADLDQDEIVNTIENIQVISDDGDEVIVKEILDKLKTGNKVNKDENPEEDLEQLFKQNDKDDVIVEAKLSNLNRVTQNQIELNQLGLNRLNVELLRSFRQIQYLYLQENRISSLGHDFFTVLNQLKYLDLRSNLLLSIPCTICYHGSLEILLLQGNCIRRVPKEIGKCVSHAFAGICPGVLPCN